GLLLSRGGGGVFGQQSARGGPAPADPAGGRFSDELLRALGVVQGRAECGAAGAGHLSEGCDPADRAAGEFVSEERSGLHRAIQGGRSSAKAERVRFGGADLRAT